MEPEIAKTDQLVNTIPTAMHHDGASARRDIAAWDSLHRAETRDRQNQFAHFYTAGRLLMAVLLFWMAYTRLGRFAATVDYVSAAGYGHASALVGLAFFLEIAGGVLLAVGWRVRTAAGVLIAYLVMVTVLLNWNQSDAANHAVAVANLGFIAALIFLIAHGAGAVSLERYLSRRARTTS
jgi:putative oxidoreductase